ncbi:Tetratricopeptide repeat protein [Rhodovastum atsumiense]|nr:tetratricopeptide repeat protein [Rhodovastum atsumiense]CAH2603721.1 Tetratricopeptide repeat protein [Rhodovastum atsumiense]
MALLRWLVTLVLLLGVAWLSPLRAQEAPRFVGAKACAACHPSETSLWKGSHHARAMQEATPATVLGDFNNASFTQFGIPTTFSRAGDRFVVRTEGPDGYPHEYDVAYTFGVDPLQQYLIRFPGGRLQALGIAWDARPKASGGQRWFGLYPEQRLRAGDRLHWTGRDQTWNYQCADCHTTDLRRNFDLATNAYATAFTDVDVACEACHGAGSVHVAWAEVRPKPPVPVTPGDRMGLANWLRPTDGGGWEMDVQTGIAHRTAPLASTEPDTCAPCHMRRKKLLDTPLVGAPLLDGYLPALLDPGYYFPDGQIDGEVFEYGSFVQSRMHQAGVTCSNCHEPHGLRLRVEGNAVCGQCHMAARFDSTAHHHHEPSGTGGQCVNCHMPTRTYMIVHDRHDHSLRVPRPDLSASLGTPNACTQCHADRPADWAARAVAAWYPAGRRTTSHFGAALQAGRTGAADAERLLDALILDAGQPPIARATALGLLRNRATGTSEAAVKAAITDPNPLVRAAVPRALPAAPGRSMVQGVAPLLNDRVRAVRVEAARALAGTEAQMTDPQRVALARGLRELLNAELVDADRSESHLNIGLLYLRLGQATQAEEAYQTALRLDPRFVPGMVNLADLDRMRGRDQEGAELLRRAIAIEPGNADAWHALGLTLVRQRNAADALQALRRANELAPGNPRYAYVYAVALNSAGMTKQAIAVLEQAHRQHPADRDVLLGLITIARDSGDPDAAQRYARDLVALTPSDPQARLLLEQLGRR